MEQADIQRIREEFESREGYTPDSLTPFLQDAVKHTFWDKLTRSEPGMPAPDPTTFTNQIDYEI